MIYRMIMRVDTSYRGEKIMRYLGKVFLICTVLTIVVPFMNLFGEDQVGLTEKVVPFPMPEINAPDKQIYLESMVISPDSEHIAYVCKNAGKLFVSQDGKKGPSYDTIQQGTPLFSLDSKQVIYVARKGAKWCVVVNNREYKAYDNVTIPVMSPDGKRMAYVARVKEGQDKSRVFVVLDNKEQKAYDLVISKNPNTLIFSPDSAHFSYITLMQKEKKMLVVSDGIEGKRYEAVMASVYSPDSKHLAYGAMENKKAFIVKDNVELERYEQIGIFSFSPDSNHMIYTIKQGTKWGLVYDGKKGALYDDVGAPRFSNDSKHIAYIVMNNKKKKMLMDGKQVGSEYEEIEFFNLSPDSKQLIFTAKKGNKWFLVKDGIEGPAYDIVSYPAYSPDSKHICYLVQQDMKAFMVRDGKRGSPYEQVMIPIYSPDSSRLSYIAKKEGKWVMVLDEKDSRKYDSIAYPTFTDDSKHFVYLAMNNNEWKLVVDGKEGKEKFVGFLKGSMIVFTSPTQFHILAVRPGPVFVKVSVKIEG